MNNGTSPATGELVALPGKLDITIAFCTASVLDALPQHLSPLDSTATPLRSRLSLSPYLPSSLYYLQPHPLTVPVSLRHTYILCLCCGDPSPCTHSELAIDCLFLRSYCHQQLISWLAAGLFASWRLLHS